MPQALEDITILDLTQVLSGPFAVSLLGDFGANIIQIEPPGGDYVRHLFASHNVEIRRMVDWGTRRNRKGMTLNLQKLKGKEVFLDLVKKSDAVVQNYTPGTMERLNLGYDILREANPRLIYCAMSGFGQTGPYREEKAYDPILQAASGINALTGFPENPPVQSGVQIADLSGAIYAVVGILLALHYRDISGEGQMIDSSLFDAACQFSLVQLMAGVNISGKDRIGNRHPVGISNVFETQDKRHISLIMLSDLEWKSLVSLLGLEDSEMSHWSSATRLRRQNEIDPLIADWVKNRTQEEVTLELTKARIAHHPVIRPLDLQIDPHVLSRELLVEVFDNECNKSLKVRGVSPKLSRTPGTIGKIDNIPGYNQHTMEILTEFLGYSENRIALLREEGII
jgi:crotonobetainyl-CoA:carnitine CoA-transferase CaiB-like acyl-CoA transferase